jgi:hypothetical protein
LDYSRHGAVSSENYGPLIGLLTLTCVPRPESEQDTAVYLILGGQLYPGEECVKVGEPWR